MTLRQRFPDSDCGPHGWDGLKTGEKKGGLNRGKSDNNLTFEWDSCRTVCCKKDSFFNVFLKPGPGFGPRRMRSVGPDRLFKLSALASFQTNTLIHASRHRLWVQLFDSAPLFELNKFNVARQMIYHSSNQKYWSCA